MNIDIVTKHDLIKLKQEIINELLKMNTPEVKQTWLRSRDVIAMLKISAGTLQALRKTGKLAYTKVNGTVFYSMDMVERMMNNG